MYKGEDDIKFIVKMEVYFEDFDKVDELMVELFKFKCKLIKIYMNLEILLVKEFKGNVIIWMFENVLKGYSKDEVMVIGDSENDFSMFKKFNYLYVMDNVNDEVKKRVNFVIKDV